MTNTELLAKIKAEIERRIKLHDSLASNAESEMITNLEIGAAQVLDDILPFLDTLEELEKPLPNDLEEAADSAYRIECEAAEKRYEEEYSTGEYCHEQSFKWGFQEGVDWHKDHMLNEAVDATVHLEPGANPIVTIGVGRFGLKVSDKVKVIIVKDD